MKWGEQSGSPMQDIASASVDSATSMHKALGMPGETLQGLRDDPRTTSHPPGQGILHKALGSSKGEYG